MTTSPFLAPVIQLAQIAIKLERHETKEGYYLLKARHVAHRAPIAQNVIDAACWLGADTAAVAEHAEPVVGGRYAMIEIPGDCLTYGIPALLKAACDARHEAIVTALANAAVGEA